MADLYDGTEFIAIDDEILEDYGMEDTHLDHLFRNQNAYLNKYGNRVGFGWVNPNQNHDAYIGDRAYASWRPLCIFFCDYYVAPGLKTLTLSFEMRVSTSDPAPPGGEPAGQIDLTVELVGFGEVTTLIESDRDYQQIDIDLDLTNIPSQTIPTLLRIWIKSYTKSSQGIDASTFRIFDNVQLIPQGGAFFPAPPATAPHPNSLAEQMMVIGGEYHEILSQAAGGTHPIAEVWPPPPTMRTTDETNDLEPDLVYLTYAQIRGFNVEEIFETRIVSQAAIKANIPVRSRTSAKHAIASARGARRPKLHLLGHYGEYDPDPEGTTSDWPYFERWRHIAHDGEHNISGGFGFKMVQDSVMFTEPAPLIDVFFWVVPWYAVGTDPEEPRFLGERYEDLIENALEMDWTFRAEVQAPGTAFSFSEDLEVRLEHLPTSISGTWPLLLQLRYRHLSMARRGYTLKEGGLYDVDFGLLTPLRIVIDASGLTEALRDRPMNFLLSVEPTAFGPDGFPSGSFNGQAATDNTYLTVVACSVWERHRF